MKEYVPKESAEQEALFRWANWMEGQHPELALMFYVPNGGSRNSVEAANLKRQGVKPGVPDLFLPVPRGIYHGLFIELKRYKGGRVSKEQTEWMAALRTMGFVAEVANGWEQAAEIISIYLKGENGC